MLRRRSGTGGGRAIAVTLLGLVTLATGCGAGSVEQTSFRVRSDFAAPLNADEGWAGALNENVVIEADRPFRLRFEVAAAPDARFGAPLMLQYRRNGGEWTAVEAHEFPYSDEDDAETPRVSIVSCAAYRQRDGTTDVLAGSALEFRPGVGVGLADRTPEWGGTPGHTEFEWALVVRRFADGAVTNDAGDTFEFRLIHDGRPLTAVSGNPALELAVPPGHVGGTFVETPGRIGPWQASNGDLYFVMEPSETDNVFMIVKSTDGGQTWREVDGANRPLTDDLESVDGRLVGDTIHLIHQVTESVRYHTFRTADHPTAADTWGIRDELAASVESVAQAATLAVRSDGSVVTFHVGETTRYSVRSPAGEWSQSTPLSTDAAPILAGPQAVTGANDVVHVAGYADDGTIWYRRLMPDGTLTENETLATDAGTTRAEYGSVLPLVFMPETDTLVVLYRLADGHLRERRVVAGGPPSAPVRVSDRAVVTHAVDSQQPGADVVLDGGALHVLFIEPSSGSIFGTNDVGGWRPSRLEVDGIRGSWVRGSIFVRPDGTTVYGYVYDAGSEGGSGMNRYAEIVLRGAVPAGETDRAPTDLSGTPTAD